MYVAAIGKEAASNSTYVQIIASQERDFALAIVPRQAIQVVQDTVLGVTMRYAFTHDTTPRQTLQHALDAVSFLTLKYGAYNQNEIDLVELKGKESGYEIPGMLISTTDRSTVVHEVAHLWFYGMVGNNQFKEAWVDESLTEWITQRYLGTVECTRTSLSASYVTNN